MLTAIGRAAARRVLRPSEAAACSFSSRLSLGSVKSSNVLAFVSSRPLTVSGRMSAAAKRSSGGTKTTATKTAKKKPTASKKKKSTASKKKAKPAVAKKTKKKVLTPEDKEKAELVKLKKLALLKGPQLLPESAWSVYVANNLRAGQGTLTEKIKDVAASFGDLSAAEKERLQTTAQSNSEKNKKTRQQWITSYPPEAIYTANLARRRIARKTNKPRVYLIHDDRLPKRSRTSYALFIKSRFSQANSETSSGNAVDTFRAIGEEWRAMSESDKQPFKDQAAREQEEGQAQLKELKEKAKAYRKA